MAEKVKVSREVAKELEQVKQPSVVVFKVASLPDECKERFGNLTFDELIRALYIGYEIEETPAEKLKDLFGKLADYDISGDGNRVACVSYSTEQQAILQALEILNIKVKGVNE